MDTPTPPAPPAAAGTCHHCGRDLAAGAWFCAECERYQPPPAGTAEPRTRRCRHCGEWMPSAAGRCNRCESFQSGIPALLPRSSATVAAASALLSLVILLISTLAGVTWWPRSDTRLALVGTDATGVSFLVHNRGNRDATLGSAWVRFAESCKWIEDRCRTLQADQEEPAGRPSVAPPTGVLEAPPGDTGFAIAEPGRKLVRFLHIAGADTLPYEKHPTGLEENCTNLEELLPRLRLCLGVEVLEEGAREFRCERIHAPAPPHRAYLRARLLCP